MKCIYPGSFDPPTLGHLDIIKRGSALFDEIIVAIGHNSQKKPLFTIEKRLEMLQKITKDLKNVEVCSFTGLLVDFVKTKKADVILRSIRTFSDFEAETKQAHMNRTLSGVETIYLQVDERFAMVSSTLIKEIIAAKKSVEKFVPKEILPWITYTY